MPVSGGVKSSNLLGSLPARPLRSRPAAKDHPPIVREGLRRLMQDMEAARSAPLPMQRPMPGHVENDVAPPPKLTLGRAAFLRKLNRIASFVERYAVPASVIFVHVEKLDAIKERNGVAGAEAAMTRVGETLTAQVWETDFVGQLGESEFGILLVKANEAEATAKAEMLSELIKASPIIRDGRAIQLSVTAGVQPL
jgi:diguanylate cyclase (GGDEF)-like protein